MTSNISFWCLLFAGAALAADPAYSGKWQLDESKSELRGLPERPPAVLTLDLQGNSMKCQAGEQECSFTLDRKEIREQTANGSKSRVAKWEGDAIILNTIVLKSGGQHSEIDRWTVSRDGNTLRIRRQVVGLHGQPESLLVYKLEGARAAVAELKPRTEVPVPPESWTVEKGTRVPLALINSVSTQNSSEGDRIYLQTVHPVMVDGRIVIPPGAFVNGTVTGVKRPGKVKGRGELYIRFDVLILPNGTTRDFRARVGSLDGEELDREEGRIRSEGDKGGDARKAGEAAESGASVGAIAGSVAGRAGMGAGVGAGAALAGVLMTRGPEAQLTAGSVVEMVLDRDLQFTRDELDRPAVR